MDMIVSSARYTAAGWILADIDGVAICAPDDPANRHRQAVAAWVAGGNMIAPYEPPPPPVPDEISDRQFAHQLVRDGRITQAEALAFVQTGTIPADLVTALDEITDSEQRFDAEMLLSGATVFKRLHPVTTMIATAFGVDRDAFFTAAATL